MSVHNSDNSIRLLTFITGGERYAADISDVSDILEVQEITFVPMLPDHIKGVINLRGKVVPVIDMAMRLGVPDELYDRHSCIVVFVVRGYSVGFLVRSIGDVIDVIPQQISETPDAKSFVKAIVTAEDGYYKLIRHVEIIEA